MSQATPQPQAARRSPGLFFGRQACAHRQPRRWRGWLGLTVALGLAWGPASVQAASSQARQAMAAFERAAGHYEGGRFSQAASLFHRAWELDPQPEYIYNAARAEHRDGRLEAAERDYRRCLELKGADQVIRKRAEGYLNEIVTARERAAAAAAARPPPASGGEKGPAPAGPLAGDVKAGEAGAWKPAAGWASLGAGVLVAGVGTWAWLRSEGEQSDLDGRLAQENAAGLIVGTDYQTYADDQRRIRTWRRAGMAGAVTGGLLMAAGAWWLWTAPEPGHVALTPGPVWAGFGLRAGF